MELVLKFLKENKQQFGINKITLRDNSFMTCDTANIWLAPMRTLQYGETFYGKFGFLPYDDVAHKQDDVGTKFYRNNKLIMETLRVANCYELIKKI